MDRCLIHPAVKFTCHSYSGPLHNSSTCYSSGAHNISFIKNPVSSSSSSSSALLCATAFHMEFILCLWAAQEREEFKDSARTQVPGGPPAETMMTLLPPPRPPTHTPTYLPPSCPPFWHWGTRAALTLQWLANAHLGAGGETPAAAEPTPGRARTQPHMHVHSHKHTHTNKGYICKGTLFPCPLSPDGSSLSSQGPAANITPRQLCHSALPLLLLLLLLPLLLPPAITPSAW